MAISQCLLNYKMKEIDIKVPNIGDFTDVEVIEVLVSQGQDIFKNDPFKYLIFALKLFENDLFNTGGTHCIFILFGFCILKYFK